MAWHDLIHLDRMMILQGAYDNGTTTWMLPVVDPTINTIVLGPDFTAAGTAIEPTISGSTATAQGDYSAGEVAIGRTFPMHLELSRPFRRDPEGNSEILETLTLMRIGILFHNTANATVRRTRNNTADNAIQVGNGTIGDTEIIDRAIDGEVSEIKMLVENPTHHPCTATAIQYVMRIAQRRG